MSGPHSGTHERIEAARQTLVNAEEAYLKANGWHRIQLGSVWLWARDSTEGDDGQKRLLIMHREDAVYFQHLRGQNDTRR